MQTSSVLDHDWSKLLSALPSSLDLDATARSFGALTRARKIKTGADLLRLALVYGPCGMSLGETAGWATLTGLAQLSKVAVMKRLRNSAAWLDHILSSLLSKRCACLTLDSDRPLRLMDGTCISQPGCKKGQHGVTWRLHANYDLKSGRFAHFELTDGRGAENLNRAPVVPGEIRLADRNFATAKGLSYIVEGGGDFIVRTGWQKAPLRRSKADPFDLFEAFETVGEDRPSDFELEIVDREKATSLPVRLVIQRKPPEAAARSREQAIKGARRRGRQVTEKTLIAAEYIMVLTSLPAETYDASTILALYRLRWQVELAFKRLKSLIHIDKLPAKDPDLAQAWLNAHLILTLLMEEFAQEILDSPPCAERCEG